MNPLTSNKAANVKKLYGALMPDCYFILRVILFFLDFLGNFSLGHFDFWIDFYTLDFFFVLRDLNFGTLVRSVFNVDCVRWLLLLCFNSVFRLFFPRNPKRWGKIVPERWGFECQKKKTDLKEIRSEIANKHNWLGNQIVLNCSRTKFEAIIVNVLVFCM